MKEKRKRYIGLDIHKHNLIALGVDADLNVVLEMTTNTWQLYDELIQYVGIVTVVHPPHVALITRSQVMNDKIAASILARLLAKGLLVEIWIPAQEIREARGLVAQRQKMTRLATQAKNVCMRGCKGITSWHEPNDSRGRHWQVCLKKGKS